MNRFLVGAAIGFSFATSAFASSPGQPLDCSDWEMLENGSSCDTYAAMGSVPLDLLRPDTNTSSGGDVVVTNTGELVRIRYSGEECGPSGTSTKIELVSFNGKADRVIARIQGRAAPGQRCDLIRPTALVGSTGSLSILSFFDAQNGRLLVPMQSYCGYYGAGQGCEAAYGGWWILSIRGFATVFEILQSYSPASVTLGFRVPVMPDGLPAADHFDTYWGNLTNPIDLAQAHPLQCDFPSTPPAPGDYLTVADPLPNPAAGTGRYYLTTVTYQGLTRAGRRATNGVLRGRDPAGMPTCVQPIAMERDR